MCFSNLPVRFDENGDPYLADDADSITRPGEGERSGADSDECGCAPEGDTAIDAAPEEAYNAILTAVPDTAPHLPASPETGDNAADGRERNATGGD